MGSGRRMIRWVTSAPGRSATISQRPKGGYYERLDCECLPIAQQAVLDGP